MNNFTIDRFGYARLPQPWIVTNTGLTVTAMRVRPVNFENSSLVAKVNIEFNGAITANMFNLVKSKKNGALVLMAPSVAGKKKDDGSVNYYNVVNILDDNLRSKLTKAATVLYNKAIAGELQAQHEAQTVGDLPF